MSTLLRITLKIVTTLVFLVLMVIAIPTLLGYQRFIITGYSMTGSISRGSVIFSQPTPAKDIKPGDVITFQTPAEYGSQTVTHRVTRIQQERNSERTYYTKGDHNRNVDPWRIQFLNGQVNRYRWHVPLVGYGLAQFASEQRRTYLVVLPALFLGLSFLWSIAAGVRTGRNNPTKSSMTDDTADVSANDPHTTDDVVNTSHHPLSLEQSVSPEHNTKETL